MRRAILVLLGVAVFAIVVANLIAARNPLRRSADDIRQSILQKTPLGTSQQEVLRVIATQSWLGQPASGGVGTPPTEKNISAQLGSYQGFPWSCRVDAYWSFDDQLRLSDVHVIRGCNSL
ncbi:MAG TPA: hypothetical protein VLK27_13520 [Chthoniobacterales bacterium]|nr:hypothetical protein [Chthoniobacterales bacterium]